MSVKINKESVAKLEELINLAIDHSYEEAAKSLGLKPGSFARVRDAVSILRKLGIDVPKRKPGISASEMAEFREWKRSRAGAKS